MLNQIVIKLKEAGIITDFLQLFLCDNTIGYQYPLRQEVAYGDDDNTFRYDDDIDGNIYLHNNRLKLLLSL